MNEKFSPLHSSFIRLHSLQRYKAIGQRTNKKKRLGWKKTGKKSLTNTHNTTEVRILNDSYFLSRPFQLETFLYANIRADEIHFTLQRFAFISSFWPLSIWLLLLCGVVTTTCFDPCKVDLLSLCSPFARYACLGMCAAFFLSYFSLILRFFCWLVNRRTVAYHMHPQLPNEFPSNLISMWFKQISVEKVSWSNPFVFINISNGKLKRC